MKQNELPKKPHASWRDMFNPQILRKITHSRRFQALYLWFSLLTLITTTLVWATIGAKLHLANADQIANSLLFTKLQSVHDSLLPQAHTFLIKWPVFLFSGILGAKAATITALTVSMALLTVTSLAYLLYRIEKRALVIGTVYFALSSMLLLVPTVPYAGALLPISMAMLTTRNVEYIIFILALVLVIRSDRNRNNKYAAGAILVLTILFASDKLFASLGLGGALVMMLLYSLFRNWRIVRFSAHWLGATVIASLLASGALWLIDAARITHIINEGSSLGPYGFITSTKDFLLGSIYAVSGLLSNFGANPAYDAVELNDIPVKLHTNLLSPAILGYVINVAFLSTGVYMTVLLAKASLFNKAPKNKPLPAAPILSAMLIATTITAVVSFIVTKHSYPVDARYLAIAFFAISVSAVTFARLIPIRPLKLTIIGVVSSLAITGSLLAATQTFQHNSNALEQYTERNDKIAAALLNHSVQYLVGDYWRVLPITILGKQAAIPSPLANCSQYRTTLTRTDWQPELKHDNFAYLLSLEKGLTDFPGCSIDDVTKHFGQPSSSIIIAGTVEQPKEVLLFFDQGKTVQPPTVKQTTSSDTIMPRPLELFRPPSCSGQTVMTIVAHQDDDLLFMNPDIQRSIETDACMRTVYVTAGDSGMGDYYWLGREKGSIAAYSQMAKIPVNAWQQKTVKLTHSAYAVIATPKHNRDISLIFLRLPDGGLQGEGFADSNYDNLAKLRNGTIASIRSVDKQSSYTNEDLKQAFSKLVSYYAPTEIRSQLARHSTSFPDHADHVAVAEYASEISKAYIAQTKDRGSMVIMKQYRGYPVRELSENVAGEEFTKKMSTFLAYSQQDEAVCHSIEECQQAETYGGYLGRQYIN